MAAADIADDELERIAARGWPGLHQHRIGGWLLRAGTGWTGRANSVLPLGDPGLPLEDAVREVETWYAAHGLPPVFQVPLPLCADLDDQLRSRGWVPYNDSSVLVADVATLTADPAGPPVILGAAPTPGWLAAYNYRGGPLPDGAEATLLAGDRPAFARIEADGQVLAIARLCVSQGWVGVTAVEVVPQARRRGLAGQLMRRGLALLGDQVSSCYLQVADSNAPALALYRGLGFTRHHGYHYCRKPV